MNKSDYTCDRSENLSPNRERKDKRVNKRAKPIGDVADFSLWEDGTIHHGIVDVEVKFLPDSRRKIAMDDKFRPYWYDRKRKCWRRIRRGGWYALRRCLRHMEETHGGEIPCISDLQQLCRVCNVEFVDLHKDEVETPSNRVRAATEELTRGITALGRVLDDDKVRGRGQIVEILTLHFRDTKGRVNQGVILARTETAARHFRARLENIRAIDAWISLYGLLVERLILSLEYHVKEVRKHLANYYRYRFNPEGSSPRKTQAYFTAYQYHLTFLRHRPFRLAWAHLNREMTELLSPSSELRARWLIENSLFSLTLLRTRIQLDRMKLHLNRMKKSLPVEEKIDRKIRAVLHWVLVHIKKTTPTQLSKTLEETNSRVRILLTDALKAYEQAEVDTTYKKIDEVLNLL